MRSFMQIGNSSTGKRALAQPFREAADQTANSKAQDMSLARPETEYPTEPEVRNAGRGGPKSKAVGLHYSSCSAQLVLAI